MPKILIYILQYSLKITSNSSMENQFECTKIKDGLYLGTLPTIQDYQFLMINKFSYVINCSAEIPNYFDNRGIKYLKFKLIKERTHKLWDQNLKKLRKLQNFIEEAEELSLCCIIFSAGGNNRSLVMLSSYLMSKYRWTLDKTLAYIRSKNIFIGLSQHNIGQLELLEHLLSQQENKQKLSKDWNGPYINDQEEIISKTYINSQEMLIEVKTEKKEKKEKRVTWQDKIDKEKKKDIREGKMKQTGMEPFKKSKSNNKFVQEASNVNNSVSSKVLSRELIESPLKKIELLKKGKKVRFSDTNQGNADVKKMGNFQQLNEGQCEQVTAQLRQNKYFSEKELIKLIKKNLKIKKQDGNPKQEQTVVQEKQEEEKGVYRFTINNFISPNINIMNSVADKLGEKLVKNSKSKKQEKNVRTHSEKERERGGKAVNQSIKQKTEKPAKNLKKNTENQPKYREKKLQKAISLQFKKNN